MKEMGETIFPSYKVGLFLVELPCGTWQALEKDSDESIKAECTLLHEYIHYIQDTATYYGVLYRNATYLKESIGAAASEIVGANIVETEGIQSEVTVVDGKLLFGNLVAGTKLMKENMAVVAQHYAFDDVCTVVIPTNNNYSAITHYIWREVPCLQLLLPIDILTIRHGSLFGTPCRCFIAVDRILSKVMYIQEESLL